LIEAPEEIANSVQFAITQIEQRLEYLKDQRSNLPEAGEAIAALEHHRVNLITLLKGVEEGDPPDQSIARWQNMLELLLDDVEKFLEAKVLVRTAFLGIAVSTCAALGASEVAQAVVAVSAIGADKKILAGARRLLGLDKDA
jgi:hypothetical protein